MIRFGFGIALRQGGCAYFTRLAFTGRLQQLEWQALLGIVSVCSQRRTGTAL